MLITVPAIPPKAELTTVAVPVTDTVISPVPAAIAVPITDALN